MGFDKDPALPNKEISSPLIVNDDSTGIRRVNTALVGPGGDLS